MTKLHAIIDDNALFLVGALDLPASGYGYRYELFATPSKRLPGLLNVRVVISRTDQGVDALDRGRLVFHDALSSAEIIHTVSVRFDAPFDLQPNETVLEVLS